MASGQLLCLTLCFVLACMHFGAKYTEGFFCHIVAESSVLEAYIMCCTCEEFSLFCCPTLFYLVWILDMDIRACVCVCVHVCICVYMCAILHIIIGPW